MSKFIDFYFDFISPYSFLAFKKIKKLNNININYKQIFLVVLQKIGVLTAPDFNQLKIKIIKNFCPLLQKKNDIEFKWNDKFPLNTLYLMRGYLYLDLKLKEIYFNKCFDAYWKNNIDISNIHNIDKILDECGIDKNIFYKKIEDRMIKDELINLTNTAFQKDVFGAPTFIVNNKIFWGQDRLNYALDEYNS